MLGKLIKYDIKNILKFISVFYIITLIISVITRIFLNYDSPFIVFLIGKHTYKLSYEALDEVF